MSRTEPPADPSATPEPHPPTVPEITPEVAEQLRHESDECSAAMAERIRRLQPQPATIPSPSVAAVIERMEQIIAGAAKKIASGQPTTAGMIIGELRHWISQLRAATAGTGEVEKLAGKLAPIAARLARLPPVERRILDRLLGRLELGQERYGPWRLQDGRILESREDTNA